MNWPPYSEYRESGVEWLGGVPEAWDVLGLRHVGTPIIGLTYAPEDVVSEAPEATLVLRSGNIQDGSLALDDVVYVTCPIPAHLRLKRGDILICSRNGSRSLIGKNLSIPQEVVGQSFGAFMTVFRSDSNQFLYWVFNSRLFEYQTATYLSATINQLTTGNLKSMKVPFPPPSEQRAIANFLESETAKIDALIAKQEQLIATLQKSRSTTVDLILDQYGFTMPRSLADLESAAPPQGWRIIRLGTVLRQLTNGFVGPTRDILVGDGVPYIQSTHIKQGRIDFDRRPFYVRQEWHDERPRIHLREGDVLIVQTGDIGKVAVVPPNFGEASCHALQIARVKPEILTGSYLGTFLSSWIGYHQLCSMATGALHPHLEAGIRAVSVVVPPLAIQSKIVRQAGEQTAKIDELVAKSSEVINTLQEYRSALITDAVTGKIDVREAVA